MSKTVSVNNMVKQIHGLADTKDVTEWENIFIKDIWDKTAMGNCVGPLSEKQVETISKIYKKHFAG